jgi:hypothetical protein
VQPRPLASVELRPQLGLDPGGALFNPRRSVRHWAPAQVGADHSAKGQQ